MSLSTESSPSLAHRPLLNKKAIVTGASRGIGAAIAKLFAKAGADVVISYSKSKAEADQVVQAIQSYGRKGFAIQANHANVDQVKSFINKAVEQLGGLDILVNNAGIYGGVNAIAPDSTSDENENKIKELWTINVASVSAAVRAASKHISKGGRIISIGSALGDSIPFPGMAEYSGTKSALQSLTRGWARDFGALEITVNLLQPGHTNTDMNPESGPFASATKNQPISRHGTVDEIAGPALFLASPASSYITASILTVDGGANA